MDDEKKEDKTDDQQGGGDQKRVGDKPGDVIDKIMDDILPGRTDDDDDPEDDDLNYITDDDDDNDGVDETSLDDRELIDHLQKKVAKLEKFEPVAKRAKAKSTAKKAFSKYPLADQKEVQQMAEKGLPDHEIYRIAKLTHVAAERVERKVREGLEKFKTEIEEKYAKAYGLPTTPTDGVGITKNPWAKETQNLTEQGRIMRDDPALAEQLKKAAGK